jgi:hypothetical protein
MGAIYGIGQAGEQALYTCSYQTGVMMRRSREAPKTEKMRRRQRSQKLSSEWKSSSSY